MVPLGEIGAVFASLMQSERPGFSGKTGQGNRQAGGKKLFPVLPGSKPEKGSEVKKNC